MKAKLKVAGKIAWAFVVSPKARRYEVWLALVLFEAVRKGFTGHA